jgi:hypothetical protein
VEVVHEGFRFAVGDHEMPVRITLRTTVYGTLSFDKLRTGGCAATPFDKLRVTTKRAIPPCPSTSSGPAADAATPFDKLRVTPCPGFSSG